MSENSREPSTLARFRRSTSPGCTPGIRNGRRTESPSVIRYGLSWMCAVMKCGRCAARCGSVARRDSLALRGAVNWGGCGVVAVGCVVGAAVVVVVVDVVVVVVVVGGVKGAEGKEEAAEEEVVCVACCAV